MFKLNLTKQQLFKKITSGLAAQGWKQSRNNKGQCSYRGKDNLRCAAGHCIPDEYYNRKMENKSWYELVEEKIVSSCNQDFIANCQYAHDTSLSPSEMKKNFNAIKKKYKLK